ncbi:FAD/NADP-binding domain-containing protein [Dacryopinax primogenitus]|uniref:FAD/NADP-binding domain-containing protein n=1 Tax=Dacryopinax primogenitus (strain DJM 731) TaxID=1858805 RepID=M5FZM0_DACPD|nr:FAD/NADP-binding domain-containing protein [Dacryopinax primogenitus]EJT99011.1 FAD/NADP-binding domain-containing protein [Dacryopinax primogenitus]
MGDSAAGSSAPLRIAIIGAGPAGLAAAIALGRLPDVELKVFEQARVLKEIGAGIGINENTWRLLKWYGADKNLDAFFKTRDDSVIDLQHRDGTTGELLSERLQKDSPVGPPYARVERYKLQNALLKEVPDGLIQLNKRLVEIRESDAGLALKFEDGTTSSDIDLLVGADGIRSVVRQHAFPNHKLSYSGKVAYRVIIPQADVARVPDIPPCACFWHTPTTHVYTNPLDEGKFEIATRALESDEDASKASWGQDATPEQVVKHYDEYNPTIRAIVAAPKSWLSFALFGGPRLESVIHNGCMALIGDAAHPLSGAFGAGAAFALEDAYILMTTLGYARSHNKTQTWALEVFDQIRGPHYEKLFHILNTYGNVNKEVFAAEPPLSASDLVRTRLEKNNAAASTGWIYKYDITRVWQERLEAIEAEAEPNAKEKDASVGQALDQVVTGAAKLSLVSA